MREKKSTLISKFFSRGDELIRFLRLTQGPIWLLDDCSDASVAGDSLQMVSLAPLVLVSMVIKIRKLSTSEAMVNKAFHDSTVTQKKIKKKKKKKSKKSISFEANRVQEGLVSVTMSGLR